MRTRSAISLTIAFSFILSGVYFAWLSPVNPYPDTRQIMTQSIALGPQETSQITFEGKAGMKINYDFNAGYQVYDSLNTIQTYPLFSVKVYNPDGKVIQIYEKVASNVSAQFVTINESGMQKIEITNADTKAISVSVNIWEVKDATRPLEPVGHWFIFLALPIIGLGIWFAIVKIEPKPID